MVAERYVPIWGGAENQLRQLLPHLRARGIEPCVVTRRWLKSMPRSEMLNDVPVNRLGIPGDSPVANSVFVAHLLLFLVRNPVNADIYHGHSAAALGVLLVVSAPLARVATVAKIATPGRVRWLARIRCGRVLLNIFKYIGAAIALSNESETELRGAGIDPERIARIPNAVDTRRFKPASDDARRAWRQTQGLGATDLIVVFSGRLVRRKGVDLLIETWRSVEREIPHAHLFILGDGANQSDSVEDELKTQASNRGLARAHFVGQVEAVSEYLAIADVFVFPSLQEGCPNALLEAMAAGLGVVASRIGGNTDLVDHRKQGLLHDAEDVDGLRENLLSMLSDSVLRQDCGRRARERVRRENDFRAVAERYDALYRDLVD